MRRNFICLLFIFN